VTTASVQGASQRAADDIVKASTNVTDALAAAGPDPESAGPRGSRAARPAHVRGSRLRAAPAAAAARDRRRGDHPEDGIAEQRAGEALDGMTSTQIRDLKLLEESLRRRPSDPETVIRLRNLSGLDPAEFAQLNLADYRDQLSESDLRALQSTQRSIRTTAVRTEAATRTRQTKDLLKAQRTEGFYKSQGLPVPDALAQQLRGLRDSLKVGGTTPATPGAPLPTTAPAKAAGSGALPTLKLPGSPPEEGAPIASLPAEWLAHARENPDYAAYLAAMGVSVE
jgi:hypothetical protein